ncbi:MAG: RtcB family protein [Leptolyngbya sp. PLA3]|nr:MAG: RtcB family protein [Cyanobacteria bacterium CYA]MCE7967954.1 RtcB family protein [Leptolyngbya sp. PL-A3]
MKARELLNLGLPRGPATRLMLETIGRAGLSREQVRELLPRLLRDPAQFRDDAVLGEVARELCGTGGRYRLDARAPLRVWGRVGEDFDQPSLDQMENARRLPVSVAAAMMPDAHVGYGLPIGGVLAVRHAVIPYAVGVDIACRVKLSVFDLPPGTLDSDAGRERLTRAIESETAFGVGAAFKSRRQHDVLDADWSVSPVTARFKDKAWSQLGTSGSGNHFVEFGTLTIDQSDADNELKLTPGTYLALLSHSGSRGVGAAVCDHYSRLAMDLRANLPRELRHLAWLDLDSQAGQEYWRAMNLMGQYASANHACIHRSISRHLGARVLADVENHHNFAWIETHDLGEGAHEYVVHRKGATPAGTGALGVIPGSMVDPCYVVRGRGGEGSIDSASHGAGRVMSRSAARNTLRWSHVKGILRERGVTLLSAGIDEAPGVYKDIRRVMSLQSDLVTPIARFDPRLVKMAPEGEKAED